MTGYKKLRTAIINRINTELATLDKEDRTIVEAVWTPADVEGMPTAVVLPEELESSYHDTGDSRRRIFAFRLYVMEEIKGRKQTDVDKELSDGIDFLIDLFDRKNPFTDAEKATISDLLHIIPIPGIWGNVTWGGGEARVASLTLRCEVIAEN